MVMSAGTVKVGGVLSATVMICTCVVVLPQSSVRVQVRVMISSPSQLPGDYNIAKWHRAKYHSYRLIGYIAGDSDGCIKVAACIFVNGNVCGTVKVGACYHLTVMTCTCVVVLPQSSVRVQVRVMISSPSQAPAATTSA